MSRESAPEFVRSGVLRDLQDYLTTWSAERLTSPDAWSDAVQRGNAWLDVSGRNQLLLTSYGVATAVAGQTTWASIPSTEPGRGCAPRAGEDPLWVRIPIVKGSATEVRSRTSPTGRATTRTEASDYEWAPVFAQEQLVRGPAEVLVWPQPPAEMRDDRAWADQVRLASRSTLGRFPSRTEPPDQVVARVGTALTSDEALGAQVGWLVASRFGRAVGAMPSFDPGDLTASERWQAMELVRTSVTRIVESIGGRFGIDMRQGPIPRMGSDDLRVAPGRRNYLSKAALADMAIGVYSEVGPYSVSEWSARGRVGVSGRASFCKVTERSYAAFYEMAEGGWRWALETVDGSNHRGLRAEGLASSLTAAKSAARSEIEVSWPNVAGRVVEPTGGLVVNPELGWVGIGDGETRTEQRVFDDRVSGVVQPGPGGRWAGAVHVDNALAEEVPLSQSRDEAIRAVDRTAALQMRVLASDVPARIDGLILASAESGQWDPEILVELAGPALFEEQAQLLADVGSLSADDLVSVLTESGRVGPATTLAVLKAEEFDMDAAVTAIDSTGLGRPEAVRQIAVRWGKSVDVVATAAKLTLEEFTTLGPSARQVLAFDPRAGLRSVGVKPLAWYTAGQDLMESGYSVADALRHVAANAPSPETIAAGATGVTEDAVGAVAVLATVVTPGDLAVIGDAYDLGDSELVALVNRSGVGFATVAAVAVEVAGGRDAGWDLVVEAYGQAEVPPPERALFDDVLSSTGPGLEAVGVEVPDNNVVELDLRR